MGVKCGVRSGVPVSKEAHVQVDDFIIEPCPGT